MLSLTLQIMARPGCLPAMPSCHCRNSMCEGMAGTLQMGVSRATAIARNLREHAGIGKQVL